MDIVPSPIDPDLEAKRAAYRAERAELRAADLAVLQQIRANDPDVLPVRWRALAAQVLSTAMREAGLLPGPIVDAHDGSARAKARRRRRVRDEARSFLTSDDRAYAASLELWCGHLDLDAEVIRERATRMLAKQRRDLLASVRVRTRPTISTPKGSHHEQDHQTAPWRSAA